MVPIDIALLGYAMKSRDLKKSTMAHEPRAQMNSNFSMYVYVSRTLVSDMSSLIQIQVLVIISFRSGKYDRYLRYETSAVVRHT